MKAVILAGGKGTRLGSLTKNLPKPMIPIGDMPLLEHQIRLLARYGLTDIILSTGHRGDCIRGYFADGSHWGVALTYVEETKPLGTAGAIRRLQDLLADDFLVLYGDVMLDVNLERFVSYHQRAGGAGTLALHPNDHPEDSDLVEIDGSTEQVPFYKVLAFHPKSRKPNRYYRNLVNAGLCILSPRIFPYLETGSDLGRDAFPRVVTREPLHGYVTAEYLKDMGTPRRLQQVRADFAAGRISRLNNHRPRPAVFLDRDGVLNRHKGLIDRPGDLELLPGVTGGIKALAAAEFLTIVVTNQPVVARNLCSLDDLDQIHGRLETLLARDGASLDAIYACPHHPHRGFAGENPKYKVACRCRKPATGMIQRAVLEFNVELTGSYLIGDSARDFDCGRRAGLTTIGVLTGAGWSSDGPQPDYTYTTFREAAEKIADCRLSIENLPTRSIDNRQSAICNARGEWQP